MNFDQNLYDTTNLNYSLNSSTNPLTQLPSNNNLSISQDFQNLSRQQRPVPPIISNYDPNIVGKSNYSSINNLLPCPDIDSGFRPKYDQETSKVSDRMRSSTASFNENSLSKQKTSLENSLHAEKPNLRASAKPPLTPGDVLSALHQKVDDLIKRGSQVRMSFTGGEKLPRASSTENRTQDNPAQVFTLSSIQPEPVDQVTNRNSVPSEAVYTKIHDLSQYSCGVNDGRDNTPQLRSSKAPVSPYQDAFLKEKNLMNTPKKLNSPRSESKETKSTFYTEIARNYSDTKYMRNHEQILPHNLQSSMRSSAHILLEEHKPRYDEKKLDAIVTRIRERNSVSPAPKQRSSVTLQEADTSLRASSAAIKAPWSTSKKNEDSFIEKREERTDRTSAIPINWHVSHIAPEEKTIDEIHNEKDVNMTGNTTILEILDKKRSVSANKPREIPAEDENGNRNPARGNKIPPGDKKTKLTVPKPINGANGVPTATVNLQDILKDLQIDQTLKVNSKDNKNTEEKAKDQVTGQNLDLKEKTLNGVAANLVVSKEEEGISNKGKQALNESPIKNSAKYFTEENEAETDVALKQALKDAGIGTATNPRLQANVKTSKGSEEMKIREGPENKLIVERGRALEQEKKSQDVKTQSSPKKTEEDSLFLDDTVFTVKEGGVNTHRQITINGNTEKTTGKNMADRNILDTTAIRNNFLVEEADISDFDFDKNRLDSQEADKSKGSIGVSHKFEENYLENLGVKVQRFSVGKEKQNEDQVRILPRNGAPKSKDYSNYAI